MDVEVRLQNIKPSEALRHYIDRRFRRALRRFDGRVRSLTLHLVDVNGPKGGVDKDCIIDAGLAPRGNVVVRERGAEFYGAIDRAAGRFRTLLSRALRRSRDRRRGRESIRTRDDFRPRRLRPGRRAGKYQRGEGRGRAFLPRSESHELREVVRGSAG